MGSPLDQVGINAEVASVIRKFIEPVIEDEDMYSEENSTSDFVRSEFLLHFSTYLTHMKFGMLTFLLC